MDIFTSNHFLNKRKNQSKTKRTTQKKIESKTEAGSQFWNLEFLICFTSVQTFNTPLIPPG